ncbi:MAG: 30S ribosomal protein S4e [Methanophagales archaeon]|nr:30S ribosomal protein S4e [Methanophagales archaeon]MCW3141202.1 30S ribosomal protein S4e [Methanophagales archaeon]
MGKHQKRIAAPRSWRIERKTAYWTVKPRPGPHPGDRSMPLLLIIRDMLKLADSSKEAKRILNEGEVVVNGRVRKDLKFPVGIFDILSIPRIKDNYIVLLDKKGKLSLVKIGQEEASKKLCRVNGKRMLKGGQIQLNLHDGRNILLEEERAEKIKTKDSLLISLPDTEILQHFAYKKGSKVMVIGGKHSAQTGEIEEIRTVQSPESNVVKIKPFGEEGTFETIDDYVFVVGEEKIEIPEVKY